jgi:hypothetical protein
MMKRFLLHTPAPDSSRNCPPKPLTATIFLFALVLICGLLFPATISAHNVSKRDASFVQSSHEAAIAPFLYLGAKFSFRRSKDDSALGAQICRSSHHR